jgi:hypothetical protein
VPSSRRARIVLPLLLLSATACAAGAEPAGEAAPSARTATSSPSAAASPSSSPSPAAPRPLLPRGGREIFPHRTVVAHYGTAATARLGVLGEGTPEQAAARLEQSAAPFAAAGGRPVLPAFELITTVARRAPGDDGTYSAPIADADVQRFLDVARAEGMLLILDFQPGLASFLDQVKRYERFLVQPEVGVALDPEWVLKPGQLPGEQIGATDAATVNAVSQYLSDLTVARDLPEKLFVLHQFRAFMIPDRDQVVDRPGLATVLHVDGFGPPGSKRETYATLSLEDGAARPGGQLHNGFKLFYDEDTDLMTPAQTMALTPRPELVSYQ